MATRRQVNNLYLKYLGRNAEPKGLEYWTRQPSTLAEIEANIARSPEAVARAASFELGDTQIGIEDPRDKTTDDIGLFGGQGGQQVQLELEGADIFALQTARQNLFNVTGEEIVDEVLQGGDGFGVFGPNPFGPDGYFSHGASGDVGGTSITSGFDNQNQASEYGRLLQDFLRIFRPYVANQDLDDIDRINRGNQAAEFLDVLEAYVKGNASLNDLRAVGVSDLAEMDGWGDYYSDFFVLDPTADIRQILRDNGYSEDAIEEIFDNMFQRINR